MASRPRPSLLALFDPLTISDTSSTTPARGELFPSPSPESGSDKENSTSTTPRGGGTKACVEGASNVQSASDTSLLMGVDRPRGLEIDLLGQSLVLEPSGDDSSNLCRVKLHDELDNACNFVDSEETSKHMNGSRVPLSEISLVSLNRNVRTPPNVARGKKLIDFDTPSTTPQSTRKLASGTRGRDDPTTPATSPFTSRPPLVSTACRTPLNGAALGSVHPAPKIPFASNSPSLLCSTPASDLVSASHDPLSERVSSSFDVLDSSSLKKVNFSGDLLNDDLSFLERLEDDSFADLGHDNHPDGMNSQFPRNPPETVKSEDQPKSGSQEKQTKTKTPTHKGSAISSRSSSHSALTFGARHEELSMMLSSPVNLEPVTPSSPSVPGLNTRGQPLAPKKTQTVIRRSHTFSRSVVGTIKEQPETRADVSQCAKSGRLRPRPSSLEIKPNTRSLSLGVKKVDVSAAINEAPVLGRRSSISRPSLGRRPSIGKSLSPTRARVPEPTRTQGENQKRPATSLGQNVRRLSVSALSKATPVKMNNFATTGRLGGARRVPLTANAPLFKSSEPTITEVQSPKPLQRTTSLQANRGPQRPPISGVSGSMCRGTTRPKAASPERTNSASISSKSRTLGRTTSASSGLFSRSSFMTSSSASMASASRLPMPPSKSTSRIPGLGARKVF